MTFLLRAASKVLFLAAAFLFFWGGRAISDVTKMDRIVAEGIGIGLAIVFAALGVAAKSAADNADDKDQPLNE